MRAQRVCGEECTARSRTSAHRSPLTVHSQRGFTLLETLIVLGIIGILAALAVPVSQQFHLSSLLRQEASALAADLRRTQAAAVAGVNDSAHGIHFDPMPTDQWVIFLGSAYSAGASGNEAHLLPSSLDMISVSLLGGGQDIVFAERRGTTAQTGTITIRSPGGAVRSVTVNSLGTVDVQ